MTEIAVMSGKGGTGKTSITAALGVLAADRAVVVDCDVDAANLHLLYDPQRSVTHEFWSGKKAVIDQDRCAHCGICLEKCRFDAISHVAGDRAAPGQYVVDALSCEGCAVCHHLCPDGAITMVDVLAGEWYESRSRFGHWFVHARLGIGQENSGKLVSEIKEAARKLAREKRKPYVIVDGPPGIGCPAIAALSGVDRVLIVTEASRSGLHDLARLVDLTEHFKVRASCVINKCDLSDDVRAGIERLCAERGVHVINGIPYAPVFHDALQEGKTVMEAGDGLVKRKIVEIWQHLERSA